MSREIDKQIAEKVFGYRFSYYVDTEDGSYDVFHEADSNITFRIPYYSADIKAVWGALEKLGCEFKITKHTTAMTVGYEVSVYKNRVGKGWDELAPMAICLAILKALEE